MDYRKLILETIRNNKALIESERKEKYDRWRSWKDRQGRSVILFGAGEMGETCVRHLEKMDIRVDMICDNNKECHGEWMTDGGRAIPIVSVQEALSGNKDILCFVAAGICHHQTISEQLEQYTIKELVLQWHLDFYLETMLYICHEKRSLADNVEELMRYFEDDESIKIIWAHIALLFEMERVPEELGKITMEGLCVMPQYFLEDGKYLKGKGIMVDCGAYVGDTLEDFLFKTKYNDFEQYDCYEMVLPTYEQLSSNVENIAEEYRRKIHTYNLGVGEGEADLPYKYIATGGSTIMPNGDALARVIRLDSAYAGKNVSFIKMDIEGSEQAALRGAQDVITTCCPICAICVYHSVAAFWEVPQILKRYVPEYKLVLRHHTTDWYDTVCYAKLGEWI